MFEQDFIIPSPGSPAGSLMYGGSSYLWLLGLLFILATLVVVYLVLDARNRSVKKSRRKEEEKKES